MQNLIQEKEEKSNNEQRVLGTVGTYFSQQYSATTDGVYYSLYDENYINTTFKLLKQLKEKYKDYKIEYDKYTAVKINENGCFNNFFHILKFNTKEKCISVQPILSFVKCDDDYVILLEEFGKETKEEKIDYIKYIKNKA